MRRNNKAIIVTASILVMATIVVLGLVLAVKVRLIRPNMIFEPTGTKGIDVSEYQGTIDFPMLMGDDIEFVYAKATEGSSHADGQFATTCQSAMANGMAIGAYHFFSFDSPGQTQAENFLGTASRLWEDGYANALVPAIDIEWYGDKKDDPPDAESVRRELGTLVDAVEASCGRKPVLYAGNDIYHRYLEGHFDDCPIWAACRKWPIWVEWRKGTWDIWQYSETGWVPGVGNEQGHTDLDVLAEGTSLDELMLGSSGKE